MLVGESFASSRTWDGIRGIDYLASREEVDPSHIGVTGSSVGGTQSTWICANDRASRWVRPSCFVTTFRRNFETGFRRTANSIHRLHSARGSI